MDKKEISCSVEPCGMPGTGGTIKGKPYCGYHFKKYMVTKPLIYETRKEGRNGLCSCGSGKKYKKCCGLVNSKTFHYYSNREKFVV